MANEALEQFRIVHAGSIAEVGRRGAADRWQLPAGALAVALEESVRSWSAGLASAPLASAIAVYLAGLNAPDLVLACACRAGIASAWEYFVANYRGVMHAAARAIARDEERARELADSLHAELYGLELRDGVRRSLFAYYHGRSSLASWLRVVIAQRHVNAHRAEQRAHAIGEALAREPESAADAADPPDPRRSHYLESFTAALAAAFSELKPRDRMRLNFHYVDELTLDQIGRIMNEHESTVSRRLARTREQIRRCVERALRRQGKLSEEQIRLCYAYAMETFPAELGRIVSGSAE